MTPYPVTLQNKMSRLHGHLYFVPGTLYFLCATRGGAWAQAVGQGIGGALGGAIATAAGPKSGAAPAIADEPALIAAVQASEGSLALTPAQIRLIKYSLWSGRAIVGTERTYGFPLGLSPDGQAALGAWARASGVATKGKALA